MSPTRQSTVSGQILFASPVSLLLGLDPFTLLLGALAMAPGIRRGHPDGLRARSHLLVQRFASTEVP